MISEGGTPRIGDSEPNLTGDFFRFEDQGPRLEPRDGWRNYVASASGPVMLGKGA